MRIPHSVPLDVIFPGFLKSGRSVFLQPLRLEIKKNYNDNTSSPSNLAYVASNIRLVFEFFNLLLGKINSNECGENG